MVPQQVDPPLEVGATDAAPPALPLAGDVGHVAEDLVVVRAHGTVPVLDGRGQGDDVPAVGPRHAM
jgi:hypothetical protein